MNLDNVNRRNTREWALFNGNAKGKQNRDKLVEKHGGVWEKKDNSWVWNKKVHHLINFSAPKKIRTLFIFTDKQGVKYVTDNFEGFCRERNINSSAMYDVITGKRKTFKGFVVERIRPEDKG
jgi:hypothetical protein